jgi:hypothetical protein
VCDLVDKKGHPGSMKIGPGFFFARTLDENFLKENVHATRTSAFKNDSSADQGLGWFSGSHAGNDAA